MHQELRGVAPIADFAAGADLADPAPDDRAGCEPIEHRFPAGEGKALRLCAG